MRAQNNIVFWTISCGTDTVHAVYLTCGARNNGLPMAKSRPHFRDGRRKKKLDCQIEKKMGSEIN